MKKFNLFLLFSVSLMSLSSCGKDSDSVEETSSIYRPSWVVDSRETTSINEDDIDILGPDYVNNLGENFYGVSSLNKAKNTINNWNSIFSDGISFKNQSNIIYEQSYVNNQLVNNKIEVNSNDDVKHVFYDKDNYACLVSRADGYSLSIPTEFTYKTDFSLGKYRSKLYNQNSTITVSYEHGNPYNNWDLYRNEWLFGYLDKDKYYEDNNLTLVNVERNNSKIKTGYIVDRYDIVINNPLRIEKPYYNIAAIRKVSSIKDFYLIVMKSVANFNKEFDYLIKSFKEIEKVGTANNNSMNNLDLFYNPNWSEETKDYYDLLINQQKTNWGLFNATLPEGRIANSSLIRNAAYTKFNTYKEALDYDFEIVPTYQHISWFGQLNNWPETAANTMCGGNGFNGKPVIQMSYQFTDNNNTLSLEDNAYFYSPIFDIYRGKDTTSTEALFDNTNKYDGTLTSLAKSIKAYGKPVLFRLNNEMNTDWTSYSGMFNLLDPDLFVATWRILYNIFEENGVDNCIWIFNPIAKTCPFSSWGEDMCYYPGNGYVHALGLTYYEDNNNNSVNETTFRQDYTALYEKNNPVWNKYPWIISEFGCGSGGNNNGKIQFANQETQAKYVKGMFADFNDRDNHPYLQNIKGAVWFNVNDYTADGSKVINQYELVIDKLPTTIQAFKEGLALNKK